MNRALLIAVCDFLILSIIAIADFNKGGEENDAIAENVVSVAEELEANLAKTLEDERNARMKLEDEMLDTLEKLKRSELNEKDLKKSIDTLASNKANLEKLIKSKDNQLLAKDIIVANQQKSLSEKAKEQKRLQLELQKKNQASKKLNQQINQLEDHLIAKQKDVDNKLKKLQQTEQMANTLKQKQMQLQQRLEREKKLASTNKKEALDAHKNTEKLTKVYMEQQEKIEALNKKLATMEKENEVILQQKSFLAEKLEDTKKQAKQTKEVIGKLNQLEKRFDAHNTAITTQVDDLFKKNEETIASKVDDVVSLSEKRISDKVNEVAKQNETIAKSIIDNKPKSIHELFKAFEKNKVTLSVQYTDKGLFKTKPYQKNIHSILFTHKNRSYALLYYKHSPLNWHRIATHIQTMSMQVQGENIPIVSFNILANDPRVVLAELSQKTKKSSYLLASNPRKFENALLIDPSSGDYALFPMQFLHKEKGYLHVPAKLSTKLFGKISPKPGTLVVSLDGQLIGLNVKSGLCHMLQSLNTKERFEMTKIGINRDHRNQHSTWEKRVTSVEFPRK